MAASRAAAEVLVEAAPPGVGEMAGKLKRIVSHLIYPQWRARLAFPQAALEAIEAEIAASEALHTGELRFVMEGNLDLIPLLRGTSARQRAIDTFSHLRIWDTEENSGVLIYVLLADRQVEILADRGISRKVDDATWQRICTTMERAFGRGQFCEGALTGVHEISRVLAEHFPASGVNPDELPNAAVLI